MMKEVELNELETENLESYHLDLSYLKERCYNEEELTQVEKLCLLFIKEDIDSLRGESIMDDAKKVEQKIRNTMIASAKLEGIEEAQKSIAKSLLKKGIDLETIAETTELSITEIRKLQENMT